MDNKRETNIVLLAAVGLVAVAVSSLTPVKANAQEAEVLHACYMPLTGIVYRIKAAGLRDRCWSKRHVEFSWVELSGAEGKVGIGVPEPTAELDVAGDIHASGQLTLGSNTIIIDPEKNRIGTLDKQPVYVIVNGKTRMHLLTGGGTSIGNENIASGKDAISLGHRTRAEGDYATAMGYGSAASGMASTAMGWESNAEGPTSVAMGYGSAAEGPNSFAMGFETTASGPGSTAIGFETTASGPTSTAIGFETTASGVNTTAIGYYATAQAANSVAFGQYNTIVGSTDSWVPTDPVLVVGNGASEASRSDAMTLLKNGNLTIAGTLTENSDARLKKDVQSLGAVLPRLEGIRGVTFRFTNEQSNPSGLHIGLLAQEVQQAFPELVHEDRNGKLSVAYGNFTAVLLEAIKEQQRENEQLRARIADLESALLRLETAVSAREK